MHVIDHGPQPWFLLEDEDGLLLDVNCNVSAFGYGWLVRLTPDEVADYRERGRDSLDRLADDIHRSAPILVASKSAYKDRNLGETLGPQVNEAIQRWLSVNDTNAN